MRASVVRIGNSRGIRIPKVVLEQCHLVDEVDLEVREDALIVRPARAPRQGWEEAFRRMAAAKDDGLLDPPGSMTTRFDRTEWDW